MSLALVGNVLLALVWLFAVPALSGVLFLRKKDSLTWIECLLAGYLFLFALSELLILPMMYFGLPLHILVACYGIATGAAAVAGMLYLARGGGLKKFPAAKDGQPASFACRLRSVSPFLWAALAVIAIQIVVVILFAHFDADDSLYVAASTTAVETDSIFRYNAYTGQIYERLPRRYVLSPFPIFLAVVSQLIGGLHPAVTAHTILPPVFLACAYCVVYLIARKWFPDDANARGIFLFLAAFLCWFSAYSVYNAGSFQMVRLWQGKAMLAAFLLPSIFYLASSIVLEEQSAYSWVLLFMADLGACLLSSMGIILAPLMIGIFVFLGLLRFRSVKRTVLGLACCIPSAILGIVYLLF